MSNAAPVVLCILDGWGISERADGNAPLLARTPAFDHIMATCPNATLITHGPDVGLPSGQMGNSEVGHTNIGAGRIVAMDLGQIDLAIENNSFATEAALVWFIDRLRASGGRAHLMGVVSDGGVHGHADHMIHVANTIAASGIPVLIHAITDGRDVAPGSAPGFIEALQAALDPSVRVATVIGRYWAMDRDNRWDRVSRAYAAMAGTGGDRAATPAAAISNAYAADVTDEFIPPSIIGDYDGMAPSDGFFCLNFRADRAREILAAIGDPAFDGFDIPTRVVPDTMLGMVSYSDVHDGYIPAVFPKRDIANTLGAWVSAHGKRQFRLAETEKYPHVTFFLNGGVEAPYPGEDRFMPPSPKVATYDLQPEMSATEVTDHLIRAIRDRYDLIVVNYANPDMVGHTGDLSAAIAACEAVDQGLSRAVRALDEVGGAMVMTADHGNCEVMIDPETGDPHTAHTTNPVPVAIYGADHVGALNAGRLADLAPTILSLMSLDQPDEMTGVSLIR